MDKIMKGIYAKGRDNARTPIQWNAEENAGFSEHEPWIGVNPNYKEINVEEALKDEDSVFHFYQKLIQIRKEYEIISTGDFELLFQEDRRFFAYKREAEGKTLVVLANFTGETVICDCTEEITLKKGKILLSNYDRTSVEEVMELKPYEAVMYYM